MQVVVKRSQLRKVVSASSNWRWLPTCACKCLQTEHKNPAAFPDMILPFNVTATTDVHKALDGCQYIVHAIPVQKSLEFLKDIKHAIPPHVPIINTSKVGDEVADKAATPASRVIMTRNRNRERDPAGPSH